MAIGLLETDIELHIEETPFIVPPVLAKTDLATEPVLQAFWSRAREELAEAEDVTFVGYSFPPTDLAARFLFGEAIRPERRGSIRVVNKLPARKERATLRASYESVFGPMAAHQFSWGGAARWIQQTWPDG